MSCSAVFCALGYERMNEDKRKVVRMMMKEGQEDGLVDVDVFWPCQRGTCPAARGGFEC